MIPIDLWSAEGRAEMRAHLDLIGEIEDAEAKLDTLKAQLPAWLGRQSLEGPSLDMREWAVGPFDFGEQKAEPTADEGQAETDTPEDAPATPEEIAAWVEDQTAQPAPVEAQAPAAEDQTDPERWIDDAMKAEIWRLDQEGYTAAGIASEMSLAPRRVQNLLYRIKSGKHPVPSDPAASTAITTTSAHGALVVPERGVARDPEMVQQWQDELAEAERRKFVARSEYPEMQA